MQDSRVVQRLSEIVQRAAVAEAVAGQLQSPTLQPEAPGLQLVTTEAVPGLTTVTEAAAGAATTAQVPAGSDPDRPLPLDQTAEQPP